MLDLKYIRGNSSLVSKSSEDKKYPVDIDHLLEIDSVYHELSQEVQGLREERNKYAKEQNIEKGRELKVTLEKKEYALSALKQELDDALLKIPNLPKEDVKVGKSEEDNEVVRKYKEPTKFEFTPLDHLALGEKLDLIDTEKASQVSGARFNYLLNEAVLLEFALVEFAMKTLLKDGFTPIIPPVLVKSDVMRGMGYMEHGGDEDMFILEKDGLALVGTAEHAMVPRFMNHTFKKDEVPKRLVGFSTAFRREVGSYGKDTRGILRVHQFDKVEMVSFVAQGEDDKEQDFLLSLEEKLFQDLGIPYQVVKMCTGDLGFPTARKYDIEAWMPSQNKYREVTSVSTITDFQSRRLNIKYTEENGERKYVNVLNGTAFAIGRTLIAVLENYQREDGSVAVPEVLREYVGTSEILPKVTKK